jgi:hypothetical protein
MIKLLKYNFFNPFQEKYHMKPITAHIEWQIIEKSER